MTSTARVKAPVSCSYREMPGVHPGVLALGNHGGQRFHCCHTFVVRHAGRGAMRPGMLPVMVRGCVAKEFAAFAIDKDRPITRYLRALARDLNEKTPGGVSASSASAGRAVSLWRPRSTTACWRRC